MSIFPFFIIIYFAGYWVLILLLLLLLVRPLQFANKRRRRRRNRRRGSNHLLVLLHASIRVYSRNNALEHCMQQQCSKQLEGDSGLRSGVGLVEETYFYTFIIISVEFSSIYSSSSCWKERHQREEEKESHQ